MASKRFTVEEVLAEVMKDEEEQEEEEDSVDRDDESLKKWILAFDGGDRMDIEFFRENAIQVLRPVFCHSFMAHTEGMSVYFYLSIRGFFCLFCIDNNCATVKINWALLTRGNLYPNPL